MNTVLTDVLITLIPGVVIPFVITCCFHLYRLLEARLPKNIKEIVNEYAPRVVHAVEQQFNMLSSTEKKTQALKMLATILDSIGLKNVNVSLLSTEIEAAVHQMNIDQIFHDSLLAAEKDASTQTGSASVSIQASNVPIVGDVGGTVGATLASTTVGAGGMIAPLLPLQGYSSPNATNTVSTINHMPNAQTSI